MLFWQEITQEIIATNIRIIKRELENIECDLKYKTNRQYID